MDEAKVAQIKNHDILFYTGFRTDSFLSKKKD